MDAIACPQCNAPVVQPAVGKRRTYCSPRCQGRAWRYRRLAAEGKTVCVVCGGARDPGRNDAGFCSDGCRFESRVRRHAPGSGECDVWFGPLTPQGYGENVAVAGAMLAAHRAAWVLANGPIPEGMHVGHTCHDAAARAGLCGGGPGCLHRRCVRLDHLELQSPSDNAYGSPFTAASRNRAKALCPAGHDLTDPDNRRSRVRDGRLQVHCRVCERDRNRERNRLVAEAAAALGLTYERYTAEYGFGSKTAKRILGL